MYPNMHFYCTAGRGTEHFVYRELHRMFETIRQVTSTDGKTYFELAEAHDDDLYQKITDLKTVERIFVQVLHTAFEKTDRRGLLTLLHTRLSNKVAWDECIATLGKLETTRTSSESNGLLETCSGVGLCNNCVVDKCSQTKRRKLQNDITFRVSCRFSGFAKKQLNVQRTSVQMGVLISKLLGWKIDLRQPRYEINIHLSENSLTVGIPITSAPLSKRSYIKHCGLRTPVARIMADLLDIQSGDVILDPMCGSGTILIEAAHFNKNVWYIGMDNNQTQIENAIDNLDFLGQTSSFNAIFIHGDSSHIPLLDDSVDGVVTDAPFGQNHTVVGSLAQFYQDFLVETSRVLKVSKNLVLLTSCAMVAHLKTLCGSCSLQIDDTILDRPKRLTEHVDLLSQNITVRDSLVTGSDNTGTCTCRDYPTAASEIDDKVERGYEINKLEQSQTLHIRADDGKRSPRETGSITGTNKGILNKELFLNEIASQPDDKMNTVSVAKTCVTFDITALHAVKLGDTEGCICVLKNTKTK